MALVPGRELVEQARTRIGDRYVFGVRVPKDEAGWTGPWDCAEFVSWVLYQKLGKLWGCVDNHEDPAFADSYSGAFVRDARKGKLVTVNEAKSFAGAVLVRSPAAGRIGHVVLCNGAGGTVEAHSSKRGVIEGQIDGRRWDYAWLVPGVTYDLQKVADPYDPEDSGQVMRMGSTGGLIQWLQDALRLRGYPGVGPSDGVFGVMTYGAVVKFQQAHGLVVDGEVGPETLAALAQE